MRWIIATLLCVAGSASAGENLPDPMRPPQLQAQAPASLPRQPRSLQVTALFISATHRAAVVDGQLVRAGDRVGTCLVEEILDDGVRCRSGRTTSVRRLPRPVIAFKKPATASAVAANGVP